MFDADKTESILESRNVTVGNKRTSMRLEPQMWEAIETIASREGMTINSICTQIDRRRSKRSLPVGLTSATRVFIISYFRLLVLQHEQTGGASDSNSESGDGEAPASTTDLEKGSSLASWVLDNIVAVDGVGFNDGMVNQVKKLHPTKEHSASREKTRR